MFSYTFLRDFCAEGETVDFMIVSYFSSMADNQIQGSCWYC